MSLTEAIILAAGRGTRMWPYGDTQPKAALPLGNTPLLVHQIEVLRESGIRRILVAADHFENTLRHMAAGLEGVEVVSVGAARGTVDSLLAALGKSHLPDKHAPEQCLVVYGDVLFFTEDAQALLHRHAAHGGPATLLVASMPADDPMPHVAAVLEDNEVTRIVARPRRGEWRWAGVAAVRREFFAAAETTPDHLTCLEVGVMPPAERDLAETLHQLIRRVRSIPAVAAKCAIVDLDKPWDILEANAAMLEYRAARLDESDFDPSATIDPSVRFDGPVVVGPGAVVGPLVRFYGPCWVGADAQVTDGAMVGAGSVIGDAAVVRQGCLIGERTAIGPRCVVGHGAEFTGVLMEGAYSYHYGEYWGVVGRNADLGAATVCGNLRFDDQLTIHRVKGRREIPPRTGANAAYLGDFTRTGVGAILMPGVKVGPYSIVGPGVILNADLPNNTLAYAKQEIITRPWGPERYGG
jgi:bifunctional UDP-N-acetylglucosamine pyrophosphorylase/glucosamine-1-phosphate N-acetyltransferase